MNEMRELTDAELDAIGGGGFWGAVAAIGGGALLGGVAGAGPLGIIVGAAAGGIICGCLYAAS